MQFHFIRLMTVLFLTYCVAVIMYSGPLPYTLNRCVSMCISVPMMMQRSVEIHMWEQHSIKREAVDQNNAVCNVNILMPTDLLKGSNIY